MTNWTGSTILIGIAAILSACGGGAGGGGSLAGGGISGTGSGTVTAIGSIVLNDRGTFQTTNSQVTIDDTAATASDINVGMVVQSDISDANSAFTSGKADRVAISHEIKGPVTSINPFQVFGQTSIVTGDTVIQRDTDNGSVSTSTIALASIPLGAEVEVSGRRDDQGVIQVSRIERKSTTLSEWQLIGTVSSLASPLLSIGSQVIDFTGITPQDCAGGLQSGDRVEVKAARPGTFSTGDTLTGVTSVKCKPDALAPGSGLTGTIQAEFEGFVTSSAVSVTGVGGFTLADQQVEVSASTQYEGGTLEDLVVGVKLDARGNYDTTSQVLTASAIRFRETRFRLEGPALLTASNQLEVLEVPVLATVQTEDDDNLVNSGTPNVQVRVKGYLDSSGTLYASEIEDRGAADINDTRVRGPVDNNTIDTVDHTFNIFGITIDGTSATEFKIEGIVVAREAFFAALDNNTEVDVEDGDFDSLEDMIRNAKLEIEVDD